MSYRSRRLSVCATAVALVCALLTAGATGAGGVEQGAAAGTGTGAGTDAALDNPKCDPQTSRFRWEFYGSPYCVKPWKQGSDNGGKVAQGVTADSVKVVALWNDLPPDQSKTGIYINQATGKDDPEGARYAAIDANEVMKHVYETWGRTVDLQFVRSTGNDEAAQRADAVTVAAMKPFAVLDLAASTGTPGVGGGSVFQQAVKSSGVPYVSPEPETQEFLSRGWALITAELIAKQKLATGRADFAGDAIKGEARKLGILRSSNFDMDFFKGQLKKYKLPVPVDAEFTVPPTQSSIRVDANTGGLEQQIPTLVAKLKGEGVTTLIMMGNHSVAGAASRAMKAQDWFPEVILTSAPYQDLDLYARSYDQDVWSHAFGMIWFPPYLQGAGDPTTAAFQWFWGPDQGTRWSIAFFQMYGVYSLLQLIGPNITAENVENRNAVYSEFGGSGGAYQDSILTIEINPAAPGQITLRAAALGWWDPNAEGPGNYNLGGSGKGKYVYLDGGERYLSGSFPTRVKPFFDPDPGDGALRHAARVGARGARLPVRRLPEHRGNRRHPGGHGCVARMCEARPCGSGSSSARRPARGHPSTTSSRRHAPQRPRASPPAGSRTSRGASTA